MGRDTCMRGRIGAVMDSGFQQGFGSLRVQRLSNKLLLHGEACPMTASKPEHQRAKPLESQLGGRREALAVSGQTRIHRESLPAAPCMMSHAPPV